jgi:hypothetical protein
VVHSICKSPSKNVENHTLDISFSFYHCGRALTRDSAIIIGVESGKTTAETESGKILKKAVAKC